MERNCDSAKDTLEWPEVLAWAEANGLANLKERLDTIRWLRQEAATTLTICLAGMGGALAYAAPIVDAVAMGRKDAMAWGAAAVCAWLAAISVMLIWACLLARPVPTLHNEALALAQRNYALMALREAELTNVQDRTNRAREEVERLAKTLNALRLAAAASPLIFLLGAVALADILALVIGSMK